jgi:bifunctional UDP-N-acetylglucosamine pyrophosphorylase/glucosamine-1-phosphate N-acetyltransferase
MKKDISNRKTACIILAAGMGKRMRSDIPKPLHEVAGLPMVQHVIKTAESLSPEKIVVVVGPDMPDMATACKPHATAIQAVPNGTGGAALAAEEQLKGFDGDILVLFGDAPLVRPATLQRLLEARRMSPAVGVVYAAMEPADPGNYGRMILNDDNSVQKIVEYKDATEKERGITLCNGGILAADGAKLFDWLRQVGNDNAQKEYYLTDLPQIARKDNRTTHVVLVDEEEMLGANTRQQLSALEALLQKRLRLQHMDNGATLIDPATVFFSYDTQIGKDVVIEPNVFFGPGVTVADNVTIRAFSHIDGATIKSGAEIGPFARLRPGTILGEDVKIGNFVETKNTHMAKGSKASHLTYLGDAEVGERSNIGAGTITCNYDGFMKHKTVIGRETFIGSNTALIAPVTIGNGAVVGAGSTISDNVPDNALGITRAPQINKDNWAPEYKQKKMREKAKKE